MSFFNQQINLYEGISISFQGRAFRASRVAHFFLRSLLQQQIHPNSLICPVQTPTLRGTGGSSCLQSGDTRDRAITASPVPFTLGLYAQEQGEMLLEPGGCQAWGMA